MAYSTRELNKAIGESYNQYFNWNNNTPFYVLAPTYLINYYNINVRTWEEWNNGWVANFHSIEKGLLPTQLASAISQKVADIIYGDGVLFESKADKGEENEALDFIGRVDEQIDIKGRIKDGILKACQLGNGLLKLNLGKNNEVWVDSLAGNRFFVNLDSKGDIVKTKTYVNIYTSGVKEQGKTPDSYGLVEERYYATDNNGDIALRNGERVPMCVYKIYKIAGTSQVFDANSSDISIAFEDLPRPIRRIFREEYNELKLDEPVEMVGFRDLGCYLLKYTEYVTGMPNIKLGESCLARILNYLPMYDAVNSEELIDLRVSRPKVIVPTFMQKGKGNNQDQLNEYDDILFERVATMNDSEQTPIVYAPIPREEHFIRMKEDIIKKICGNLGVATSSLFSDIADTRGNVTAREISSEESNTVLFQVNKRKILIKAINELVADILYYYGMAEDVKVTFTPAGSSNKSVTVDNTVKMVNAGLISKYQAVKENHPDWTDSQILEELAEIEKQTATESGKEEEINNKDDTEADKTEDVEE